MMLDETVSVKVLNMALATIMRVIIIIAIIIYITIITTKEGIQT